MKYDRVSLTMLLFVHTSFSLFGMERGHTLIAKGHDLASLLGTYPKFITGEIPYLGWAFLPKQLSAIYNWDPWLLISVFFAGATIFLGIIAFMYHRKLKGIQLEHSELQKRIGQTIKASPPRKKVPSDTLNRLCEKIDEFEREKGYLDRKVNLQDLSKEMETNSSYLSKAINQYKGKTFARYLADLRIDYTLHCLNNDEKIRHYKISAIALEVGFSTTESFTRSFIRKTGLYPSHYLNQLKGKASVENPKGEKELKE